MKYSNRAICSSAQLFTPIHNALNLQNNTVDGYRLLDLTTGSDILVTRIKTDGFQFIETKAKCL